MSEIKTATAWLSEDNQACSSSFNHDEYVVPGVTVYGASESDILAGLALLAKSREVCEWKPWSKGAFVTQYETSCNWAIEQSNNVTVKKQDLKFCPSCGRSVKITEGE